MRLVFVEDDADMRDTVVECMRLRGYDVIEAPTAEAAMQLLVMCPAPALAVTDIDLGAGRSGIEFADWLHGRWPELPVIFASAQLDRLHGRAFDPRETCLAKPFTLRRLIELMCDAPYHCPHQQTAHEKQSAPPQSWWRLWPGAN